MKLFESLSQPRTEAIPGNPLVQGFQGVDELAEGFQAVIKVKQSGLGHGIRSLCDSL